MPKSRLDFWGPKLRGNRQRDERVKVNLENQGWRVIEVWECETKPEHLRKLVADIKNSKLSPSYKQSSKNAVRVRK
jgi:DNA mismatch endonuclease (patch repair protein)